MSTVIGLVILVLAFARPDLAGLARGLKFSRGNDYPIRGRLAA